jgi:hypothetical protein
MKTGGYGFVAAFFVSRFALFCRNISVEKQGFRMTAAAPRNNHATEQTHRR